MTVPRMRLILASRSPRRAELLTRLGLSFEVCAADVDESAQPDEAAADYVVRLARDKARAVFAGAPVAGTAFDSAIDDGALGKGACAEDVLVVGADTAVVLDERILGKPADQTEAVDMLLTLSGRTHRVMTGVAVHGDRGTRSLCVVTEVHFRLIEPWEAEAYWRTGEGSDKAGGYGIQGIGGIFADSIRGSYSAVVGLPLAETEQLLRESGLDTWRERTHG
jgi:septum formation protein